MQPSARINSARGGERPRGPRAQAPDPRPALCPQGGPWAPEAVALLAFREGFEQSSQRTKPQTTRPLCSEGVPRMCVSPNTSCHVGSRWPRSRVVPHCRRCAGAHWQGQRWDPALLPKSSHSGTHPSPAAACGQPLQVS